MNPTPVFIYRCKSDGHIAALYADDARAMHGRDDFEHIATVEPRAWIESNFEKAISATRMRITLQQILVDAQAQEVLPEWWPIIETEIGNDGEMGETR